MKTMSSVAGTVCAVVISVPFTIAGGSSGVLVSGVSVFSWCAALIFACQWIVFVPSWIRSSEQFFDLTGSLTFAVVTVFALFASRPVTGRAVLLSVLVFVWALRLGLFLHLRVRLVGSDRRFDKIKRRFAWFLMTWTLQGLWILVTVSPVLAAVSVSESSSLGFFAVVGVIVWSVGFVLEVAADEQKRRFRAQPENRECFIQTGLWAWSRHPNYLGEICVWSGVSLVAAPALAGWSYVTLISPIFVWFLLTRISGIPMLESSADRRWSDDLAYQEYRANTGLLLPRFR